MVTVSALWVTEVAKQALDSFGYFSGMGVQLVELHLDQALAFEHQVAG